MKCPKCGYLGFETSDRCRNCGYDFSLSQHAAPTPELPLQQATGAGTPLADLELTRPTPRAAERTPDLDLDKHPIFNFFLDEANPLIRGVTVRKFRRLPPKWEPAPESNTAIIGRLRDKSPLFIEKPFGDGKVLLTGTQPA